MEEKYFAISESDLRFMLKNSFKCIALENGGVDNWSYYYDAICDYIAQDPIATDIEDMVEHDMGTFHQIKVLEDEKIGIVKFD